MKQIDGGRSAFDALMPTVASEERHRQEDAQPYTTSYKGFTLYYTTGSQHGTVVVKDSNGKKVASKANAEEAKKWCAEHAY